MDAIPIFKYLPKEDISDLANSNAYDWITSLWNHSRRSRFIVLEEEFFNTLTIHPEICEGVRCGWIIVEHTALFFPLMGLTIINEIQLKAYNVCSPIKQHTK